MSPEIGEKKGRFTTEIEQMFFEDYVSQKKAFAIVVHIHPIQFSPQQQIGGEVTSVFLNPYEAMTDTKGLQLHLLTADSHESDQNLKNKDYLTSNRNVELMSTKDLRQLIVLTLFLRNVLLWESAIQKFEELLLAQAKNKLNRTLIIVGHGIKIENQLWIGEGKRDAQLHDLYIKRMNALTKVDANATEHQPSWRNRMPAEFLVENLSRMYPDTGNIVVMSCNDAPYNFLKPKVSIPVFYLLGENKKYGRERNLAALHNKTAVFDRGRTQVFAAEQVLSKGRITYV